MKAFGFAFGGYDHPYGYTILLTGPDISHINTDEFLSSFDDSFDLVPVLQYLDLEGVGVTYFFHVEHRHSVRRKCAKDYKENGNSYFIHSDLLFCSLYFLRYSRRVGKLPTSLRMGFGFLE